MAPASLTSIAISPSLHPRARFFFVSTSSHSITGHPSNSSRTLTSRTNHEHQDGDDRVHPPPAQEKHMGPCVGGANVHHPVPVHRDFHRWETGVHGAERRAQVVSRSIAARADEWLDVTVLSFGDISPGPRRECDGVHNIQTVSVCLKASRGVKNRLHMRIGMKVGWRRKVRSQGQGNESRQLDGTSTTLARK